MQLDPAVESFVGRQGRVVWSIDPLEFTLTLFDANDVFAPDATLGHGRNWNETSARADALIELQCRRRKLNRAIRELQRKLSEAAA